MKHRFFHSLKFQQKLKFSFNAMLAFLAVNAVIACITAVYITWKIETLHTIGHIIQNVGQIALAERSFSRSLSGDDAKRINRLLDETRQQLHEIGAASVMGENVSIISLLDDFKGNFQKYAIQRDQVAALESRVIAIGKSLTATMDTARSSNAVLFQGVDINHIMSSILKLQILTREHQISKTSPDVRQLRSIVDGLTAYGERARMKPRTIEAQRIFFTINRDARDYVQTYERQINAQLLTRDTEFKLSNILGDIHQYCLKSETVIRRTIHGSLIVAGALFVALLILSILAARVMGAFLARQITTPVSELVNVTRRFGRGEHDARAVVAFDDEIGELAGSFNMMADSIRQTADELKSYNENLEQRVRERTEEVAAATSSLAKSERFLNVIIDTEPECIKLLDADSRVLFMNRAGLEMIQADSFEQVKGECVCPLITDPYRADFVALTNSIFQGKSGTLEFETVGLKGRRIWLETHAVPFRDEHDEITALLGITRDITARKHSEEEQENLQKQMLHVQKLESLGVLAGGIAHDFNNILTAIIGNADLALMRISKESPVAENLHRIEQAAARAADLAKQMLAYSGKGKFVVETLDLNKLVEEMWHMLEVSISKKAVLRLTPYHHLPAVEADATQIRQIIMNLVINASEAIGDKNGVIAVTTGCQECSEAYLKGAWLSAPIPEGQYVYLEVTDTGCGMDKETQGKIFDPFFTTKFTGRGLGMAAVLGIVRGHKGAIMVQSELNKGTTFKILLPASDCPAEEFNEDTVHEDKRCEGTVLLVDDEETVRGIGAEMLMELGFEVITANDGREALDKYRDNPGITLVILDLTMPQMDGGQCFRELKQLDSKVKVIVSSGFSEQEVEQTFASKGLAGFIQKPYKLSMLRNEINKVTAAPT